MMILLELLELYLHRASTLSELIERLHNYYRESIFIFFLVHPTLYFVLGVLLFFDAFNFFGISILLLKVIDLFFKLELIKQRYYKQSMDPEIEKMLDMKLTFSMKILALSVHVPFLYMAISSVLA
ncbi:MAG TPA: hypothetical protein ENK94_01475 [Campylobacterales bacterium]|nr:hypothetical protein [Campylobacterales bacterium]